MSATPVKMEWMNKELGPPSPNAKCGLLPIYTNGQVCTSVWQLDDEAMRWVIENRCIVVQVWSGVTQPPIAVSELKTRVE